MLKALNGEGPLVDEGVSSGVKTRRNTKDWQTGVIIPIYKKSDRKECKNYREILLLSLPGEMYAEFLERKCQEKMKSKLEDDQCGFHPGRSTTDQIFAEANF